MDGVDNESRISRLESEIRYLKGLLDENGIAYDYETYVDSSKKEETCSDRISCADGRACYTVLFLLSRAQGCVCEAGGKERILYAM